MTDDSMKKQILVTAIAMIFVGMAFSGMSGLAIENDGTEPIIIERVGNEDMQLAKLPADVLIKNIETAKALKSGVGNDIMATPFTDGFETYTPGLPPDDPPWQYQLENDTGTDWYDSFETVAVGENPDPAVWNTIDGAAEGLIYWGKDFEDTTVGQNLAAGYLDGDSGGFRSMVGDATVTAQTRPTGTPPGSIDATMTPGTLCAYFNEGTDSGADTSYVGPAGIGEGLTDHAYLGFWFRATDTDRTDFYALDYNTMAYSFSITIYGGSIYHWPGGTPTVFGTYTTNTWHEVFYEYDDVAQEYQVWYDGTLEVTWTAYEEAPGSTNAQVMFGGEGMPYGASSLYIDNWRNFNLASGGSETIYVDDTWAYTADEGVQSLFMDQNNEPTQAYTEASFTPFWGDEVWVGFDIMTDTVATTSGATFYGVDWMGTNIIGMRFLSGNIQYYSSGSWVTLTTYADATEYYLEMVYNDQTMQYVDIYVNYVSLASNVPLGATGAGIAGFRMEGTPGTQSTIWMDGPYIWAENPADAILEVVDTVANTGSQSLRLLERGADTYSYFGTAVAGGVGMRFGEFTFSFYTGIPQGGTDIFLWDSTGASLMTLISLGTDLGGGAHPGSVQFIDNDGTGYWIMPGPTFAPNTWNELTIQYDCNAGTFEPFWNSVSQGVYGMYDPAADVAYLEFYGGAPDTSADFYFDDISLWTDDPPASPTDLTVHQWGASNSNTLYDYTAYGAGNKQGYAKNVNGGTFTATNFDMNAGGTWAELTAVQYGNIAVIDDASVWEYDNANAKFYRYHIHVNEAEGDISSITGLWDAAAFERANAATLYIWDSTANTWVQLATGTPVDGGPLQLTGSATGTMANYIDTSGYAYLGIYVVDPGNQARWVRTDYVSLTVQTSGAPSTDHNTLNWTHDGTDVAQYNIYRDADGTGATFTLIDSVPVGTNTYTDQNRGTADAILWWYIVRAQDPLGNEDQNMNAVQEPGGAVEEAYNINLAGITAGGWAFVSFPIAINGNIETLLPDEIGGTQWDVAKWWDGATQSWKSFRRSTNTNTFTDVNNQVGLWLHLTVNDGDQILPTGLTGSYPTAGVAITLYAGWNMVGYPSATDRAADVALAGTGATMVSVYSAAEPYITDHTDLAGVTMSHGHAYWVLVPATTTWTVNP